MTHAHHDTHTGEGERLDQASLALATPTGHGADAHDHDAHSEHHGAGHGGGHMGHGGHGDHAAQFRDRFWWSLLLALPVVGFSRMFADLLGYMPPPGTEWIPPVLGTVVFLYGGWPFLSGAVAELRSRQPGMMLLVAMAITVAFVASGQMAVAYFQSHLPRGFWPILNGGELAALYCFLFLYIASRGSGKWSVR